MNNKSLVGTAFEWALISTNSARISNDIEKLVPILSIYQIPTNEMKTILDAQQLLKSYHYKYSSSSFNKEFNL